MPDESGNTQSLGIIRVKGGDEETKTQPITESQIDRMAEMAGSYEALFSRRAMKYKGMGLKEKTLSEQDYRQLILDEYTFLKRPVIIINDQIFVGNAKKEVEGVKKTLGHNNFR